MERFVTATKKSTGRVISLGMNINMESRLNYVYYDAKYSTRMVV